VRGKLVPQDPNDEPAEELLKRIAKEKARLVKAGERRDRLAPPAVAEDEAPFGVPSTWRWVRFGNIVDFSAGRTPSRHDPSFWNTGDHAWVSIADMEDGQVVSATKETVSERARERVFGSEPEEPGTIIMSFKLTIGKIARLGVPAFHNEAIISIRPHLAELDGYLFKVLPQFARQGDTKGAIKGATLNRDSISNIILPLPPLAEQHRIVAKVDELMGLCDRLEAARAGRETVRDRLAAASLARLNAPDTKASPAKVGTGFASGDASEQESTFQSDARFALDALPALTTRPDQIKCLRQTILNLAVRGKLVPQDPNDEPASELLKRERIAFLPDGPFEIPRSWCWVRVGAVSEARLGKMLDKAKNKGTPRPYLRNINVRWFDFDLSDVLLMPFEDSELEEYSLRFGDVLICEGGEPGRAAVWDERTQGIFFQKAIHRVRFAAFVNSNFFVRALKASADDGRLAKSFTGTGIKHFTGRGLDGYAFPLPPLAEQRRIVAKVDALMAICDRLEASLTATAATRRRLLDALLAEALVPVDARELDLRMSRTHSSLWG